MRATFSNTVDILVKAYLNDTLLHSNCWACAVGNMVAANVGYKVKRIQDDCRLYPDAVWVNRLGLTGIPEWDNVFCTDSEGDQDINPEAYHSYAKAQIDATGYTWEQLALIEKAFESVAYEERNSDQHMLDGLFAVVDVLADIHQISLEAKEKSKLLFVKL